MRPEGRPLLQVLACLLREAAALDGHAAQEVLSGLTCLRSVFNQQAEAAALEGEEHWPLGQFEPGEGVNFFL